MSLPAVRRTNTSGSVKPAAVIMPAQTVLPECPACVKRFTRNSTKILCAFCEIKYHSFCSRTLPKLPNDAFRMCRNRDFILRYSTNASNASSDALLDSTNASNVNSFHRADSVSEISENTVQLDDLDQALEDMRNKLEKSFREIISESIAKLKSDLNNYFVSLENRVFDLETAKD